MGMIRDRMKFKITRQKTHPTNPTGNVNQLTDHFDIYATTIKKKQNKM